MVICLRVPRRISSSPSIHPRPIDSKIRYLRIDTDWLVLMQQKKVYSPRHVKHIKNLPSSCSPVLSHKNRVTDVKIRNKNRGNCLPVSLRQLSKNCTTLSKQSGTCVCRALQTVSLPNVIFATQSIDLSSSSCKYK